MTKTQRSAARRRYIAKRRRACWGSQCSICGSRWQQAKSNFYVPTSGTCQGCLSHVSAMIRKGAAWMLKRRSTLDLWGTRLTHATPRKRARRAS